MVARPRYPLATLYREGYGDRLWYDNVQADLRTMFGDDGDMMLAFLAATSPRANLRTNVAKALRAYAQWKAGVPFPGHLPAHTANLLRATAGLPLNGPKVGPFHRALSGDGSAVVVDVWMLDLYGLPDRPTLGSIRHVQASICRLAERVNDQPRRVQAAIWCAYKRRVQGPHTTVADYVTLLKERV